MRPLLLSIKLWLSRLYRHALDVLEVDDVLTLLAKLDEREAKVIELRYFGGMSREEIACVAGLTLVTVKRDLRLAGAWLRRDLMGKALGGGFGNRAVGSH